MPRWAIASALATLLAPASALTLFDPAAGLPSAQGWAPLIVGNAGSDGIVAGRYVLDTTSAGVSTDGRGRVSPFTLDTAAGFSLSFDLRLASESHSSTNRAGFSILLVGSNTTHSLELAFWGSEVFAYDYVAADADRFVHGAGALLDTTASFRHYVLAVQNQLYTLSSGGSTLLSGALKDYTAQGQPYTTPNFLFFGDDTSRAASSVELGPLVIGAVPEPSLAWMWALGLVGVLGAARSRRARGQPAG